MGGIGIQAPDLPVLPVFMAAECSGVPEARNRRGGGTWLLA